MVIDTSEIGPEVLRVDTPADPGRVANESAERLTWLGAHLSGVARRESNAVVLSARIQARVRTECMRCLAETELGISADFEIRVVPRAPDPGGGEHVLDPDEALLYEAPDGKVDLDALAREQAYLALPLKILCRTDCRGLCPACGIDRNHLECRCETRPIDPRLAPLLKMKPAGKS